MVLHRSYVIYSCFVCRKSRRQLFSLTYYRARREPFIKMNTLTFVKIFPFLAAVECHFLAQYFVDPCKGCAADVPVDQNYRQTFQETHRAFPTYERALNIFRNGFSELPPYAGETTIVECGSSGGKAEKNWARESLDCTRNLETEMNHIIDKMVSITADKFDTVMDQYVENSLKILEAYEKYVFVNYNGTRPDWLKEPFDYLKFVGSDENVQCGLRFLFDGQHARFDEIYRKYAFFGGSDAVDGKMTENSAELRLLVSALSGVGRSRDERESHDTDPQFSNNFDSQRNGLIALKNDLDKFLKPICENTTGRSSISALKWSFLKSWPHYDEGFFVNKSLAAHEAVLGDKRISLKIVFDSLEFEHSFEGIMAASELVPFILHNYIVDVALHLILFAIRANNRLLRFLTREDPDISKDKRPKSHVFSNKNEDTYYKYFGRQITIFRLAYKHYCQVMKHDDTLIVNLLDSITKLYNGMATNVEIIEKNIVELKVVLTSRFKWSKANVDKVEDMEISIEGLVDVMERINFRFFGLTEFIIDSKI